MTTSPTSLRVEHSHNTPQNSSGNTKVSSVNVSSDPQTTWKNRAVQGFWSLAIDMGVSINWGIPQNRWFIVENPNLKWMMTGLPRLMESPILGDHGSGACFQQDLEPANLPAALQLLNLGPGYDSPLHRVKLPQSLRNLSQGVEQQRISWHFLLFILIEMSKCHTVAW